MNRLLLGAALALALGRPALADTYRDAAGTIIPGVTPLVGCANTSPCVGPVSATNPLPVSGSFSATLSGFAPTPAYSQLAVGASSARVALPAGTTVVVYNTGANAAFVALGNNTVVATTTNDVIQPNSWMAFTVGANTYIAAIETAGATALNVSGGAGLPTGAGGGGGSGGGSSASVGSNGSAVPASGTYAAMNVGGTLTGLAGTANGLKVDGSSVTQPVSGTFWQATQPVSGTVTANSGTNLNTSLLALESGGNLASIKTNTTTTAAGTTASSALPVQGVTGGVAISVSAATLPLPAGAATASNQPTNAAIGSTTSGQTGNLDLAAVTAGAPSYTAGQTDPLSLDTAGNLRISCVTGCAGGAGGTSATDQAAFTYGTSTYTPIGGVYNSTIANLTSGQGGAVALTSDRNVFVNMSKLAGTTLGAPSNYGTPPGAVAVPGVNAFVTNTPAVTQSGGPWTMNETQIASTALGAPTAWGTAPSGSVQGVNANVLNSSLAVTGTFWQATQPVSAASLPLPTGAATAANQTSVIGPVAAGTAATNSLAMGGVYNSSLPTLANGQQAAEQLDMNGRQLVNVGVLPPIPAGANTIGAVTQASGPWTENQTQIAGAAIAIAASGVQKVGVVGNAGAVVDAPVGAGSAPANMIVGGLLYNSSPPTPSTGQSVALQGDSLGNLKVNVANTPTVTDSTIVAQGSTTAGETGPLIQGAVTTSAPSYATGKTNALSLDTTGNLRINCVTGCSGAGGTSATDNTGFTYGSGTFTPIGGVYNSAITNLTSGDAGAAALSANRSLHVLDDNSAALLAALSGATPAGTNIIGKVGIDQTTPGATNAVVPTAAAAGGASTYRVIWPNNTTGVNIKASAGTVYDWSFSGIGSSPAYVKLYNKATAPTCGTDAPVAGPLVIPAAATAANGAGSNFALPVGMAFSLGIGICVTGGIADADTTAVAASTFAVTLHYQ